MPHEDILALVNARAGHFAYESGHHSDMWLELETLCASPAALDRFVVELAEQIAPYQPAVICGPLVEGAFVALLVAAKLNCRFVYANRHLPGGPNPASPHQGGPNQGGPPASSELFPVRYRIPQPLHATVAEQRVVIVNDVISAGSAVRGAYEHLRELQARVVAVAALVTLGDEFARWAERCAEPDRLPLVTLLQKPNNIWTPDACPLCARGERLDYLANA